MHLERQKAPLKALKVLAVGLSVCLLLSGCQSWTIRVYGDRVPAGSLRLSQVTYVHSRNDIVERNELHNIFIEAGIKDDELVDGSVAFTRIYCCGGPNEKGEMRIVYVPPNLNTKPGDVVEVRVGNPPKAGNPGVANMVTQVRQRVGEAGSCRWDPPDDRLWVRTIYADWMPGEGWVRQGGLYPTWYKPPTSGR
jgi:hypothetical protein